MSRLYFLLITLLSLCPLCDYAQTDSTASSQNLQKERSDEDSPIRIHSDIRKTDRFIAMNSGFGEALLTNEYLRERNSMPSYIAGTFKFGMRANGNQWTDYAYGMPYIGVGVYSLNIFGKESRMGTPVSIYLFSGSRIKTFSQRMWWAYEWNLGMSFNWNPYDPFDNPYNVTLGSSVNAHIALASYIAWEISRRWTFNFGVQLTHFSNGAQKLPNKGLNLYSGFFQADFLLDKRKEFKKPDPSELVPPPFRKRIDYDITATVSSHQITFDTVGTGLPTEFLNKKFTVLGMTFSPMYVPTYKYKFGPFIDFLYDESIGAKAYMRRNPADGHDYIRYSYGSVGSRFSLGLGMKGEVVLPYYSVTGQLGYDVIHADDMLPRLYQVIALKLPFGDCLYGAVGIRATNFSRAQCIYASIGYAIPQVFHRRQYLE
jgi:hypothetical protein